MVADARQAADGEPWITGTVVSEGADTAKARVYLPLPESSEVTAATELLLELTAKPDGWHVDTANVRFHCRRTARDSFCG